MPKSASVIKRFLAAIFGGILFCILLPVLSMLLISVPETIMGFVGFAAVGFVVGVILGACFPRVFGFIFESMLEI